MRAKMTIFSTLSLALFIVLLGAIYLFYARSSAERNFAASLDRIALESAKIARRGANTNELRAQIEEHNSQVTESGAISEAVEAWILDARGQLVWRFGPPRPHSGFKAFKKPRGGSNSPLIQPTELWEKAKSRLIPPLDDPQGWRARALPWNGQKLILALPWRRARRDLNTQAAALGLLGLLISGAAASGAWILVGKTLRPIDALAEQARQAARRPMQLMERRAPLLPTSSDFEMQNLVTTLNQMLDSVREAALSKERFHTSASHELRTPLQALGGHLGVALARERSAPDYKVALQEAARQTARLSKLTGDLLLLNRLQTAASVSTRESVDVAEMCDIALQRAQKIIAARALEVVESWQALEIEAPPSHVEILLGNLVENAAKYAASGDKIGIEIDSQNQSVRVWNRCEISSYQALQSEIPHLFEPFYRPDTARASETGGNGLGLAICQTLAETNGWQLEIEARDQKFSVRAVFLTRAER